MVVRQMLAASALTTLGSIAPFLLASQAVLIRQDLGLGAASFGVAISVFFAAAAVVVTLLGRVSDRLSAPLGAGAAGACIGAGALWIAAGAQGLIGLVVAMAVIGGGNALCQATANRIVAVGVPPGSRGLGFGIKQSAVPAAIMLGGLAVPTTTRWLGWESTFWILGGVGVLLVCGAGAVLWRRRRTPAGASRPEGAEARKRPLVAAEIADRAAAPERPPTRPLFWCGAATLMGSVAANFLGSYLPTWAFEVGISVSDAGLLVAVGSGACVVMRVLIGWLADRRYGDNLRVVMILMGCGAACLLGLALVPVPWAVVMFGVLCYVLGWSWPGLGLFAVARVGRDTPTAATSVVQSGAFLGGAVGPASLGVVVSVGGFPVAWTVAASIMTLGVVCFLLARRGFRADLHARPPRQEFGYGGGRREPRYRIGGAGAD